MFDRIAPRYDLVNTVLSGASDGRWRRRTAQRAGIGPGSRALDVACGSGRLSRELAGISGPGGLVVGLDFSAGMLKVAGRAVEGTRLVRGDALALPFADGVFDAVTIAFGLRNLAEPVAGLKEMRRVLRRGGRAVVLEFVRPGRGPVAGAYRLYLRRVLPALGGLVSGDRAAYRYLGVTVDSYRTPEQLRSMAGAAGWREVAFETMTLGTVGILSGTA